METFKKFASIVRIFTIFNITAKSSELHKRVQKSGESETLELKFFNALTGFN